MTANPHGIEQCATEPEAERQLEMETAAEIESKPEAEAKAKAERIADCSIKIN